MNMTTIESLGQLTTGTCTVYMSPDLFLWGQYANENDLHTLNWLPMSKRRDFIVLRLVFKVLHNKNWPSYLALENAK